MPILDELKQILVNTLAVDESLITLDSSFIDDLSADSLDLVELIMAIEGKFKISIPDEDAEKLTTVRAALGYLQTKGIKVD